MADEKEPLFIDLTQIFYKYGKAPRRSFSDFIYGCPPESPIVGYTSITLTINANNIEAMTDAENPAQLNTNPHPTTTVELTTGKRPHVQETKEEIKQKIAAAKAAKIIKSNTP